MRLALRDADQMGGLVLAHDPALGQMPDAMRLPGADGGTSEGRTDEDVEAALSLFALALGEHAYDPRLNELARKWKADGNASETGSPVEREAEVVRRVAVDEHVSP